MLESDAKEVRDGQMELHDFDYATVEAAVLFFYDLPSYLPVSVTMSLLLFAEKFGIADLKVCCINCFSITVVNVLTFQDRSESMLLKRITTSNVVKVANLALEANAKKVRECCFEYLLKCLHKSYPVCDYADLNKSFALDLLSNAFAFVSK